MHLYEYQAKALLRREKVAVPPGCVAATAAEAVCAASELGYPVFIKAQVHAGGRGKAGGVRRAANRVEASSVVAAVLGMRLRTAQSGERGLTVDRVLVEGGVEVARELYFSLLPDRDRAMLMFVVSRAGGTDIEETAVRAPEEIIRVAVDPLAGLHPYHCRRLCVGLGLEGEAAKALTRLAQHIYHLVTTRDLLLVEINPLAVTVAGELVALDAKIEVDDNALFRQPELARMRDSGDDDPLELEARKHNLNYIRLNGTVGTMVNGAGLAMATMDMICQAGLSPANFLDVGGGASAEMIEAGFRILLRDQGVGMIFINIFGGILRCDVLARGVVEAAGKVGLPVPLLVRMEGTNAEAGRRMLAESGLKIETAVDLDDASRKLAVMGVQV